MSEDPQSPLHSQTFLVRPHLPKINTHSTLMRHAETRRKTYRNNHHERQIHLLLYCFVGRDCYGRSVTHANWWNYITLCHVSGVFHTTKPTPLT